MFMICVYCGSVFFPLHVNAFGASSATVDGQMRRPFTKYVVFEYDICTSTGFALDTVSEPDVSRSKSKTYGPSLPTLLVTVTPSDATKQFASGADDARIAMNALKSTGLEAAIGYTATARIDCVLATSVAGRTNAR